MMRVNSKKKQVKATHYPISAWCQSAGVHEDLVLLLGSLTRNLAPRHYHVSWFN